MIQSKNNNTFLSTTFFLVTLSFPFTVQAQTQTPDNLEPLQELVPPRQIQPLPEQTLPSPNQKILPTLPSTDNPTIPEDSEKITVTQFQFTGNTVFATSELEARATAGLIGQEISISRLVQVATDVAQIYAQAGYTTSGAFVSIPEATYSEKKGIITVEVIEGKLTQINVTATNDSNFVKLNPGYIRSRIVLKAGTPLNVLKLQEALQLLQLDPLINDLSAQLSDGAQQGTSILDVKYSTTDTFQAQVILDNYRAASVGTFRRGVALEEANLLGLGDRLRLEYRNTEGSNDWETSYSLPVNPYNGELELRFRTLTSRVITPEFESFNIESDYQQYQLTFRQPIHQTPQREISLGITFDRQETGSSIDDRKFPLSPGANLRGETKISTIRFFQEWFERSRNNLFALRSSFDFGVDFLDTTRAFDASINPDAPESEYFLWRGQVQYVHLFAPDTLLIARSNIQLSDNRTILPLERFVLGGFDTVRGYPENFRLTDNGVIATVEARLPVYRKPQEQILLQLIPFVDFGTGWNNRTNEIQPDILASVGMGLSFNYRDIIQARLDYGIPLTEVTNKGDSLQENGFSFSLLFTPF